VPSLKQNNLPSIALLVLVFNLSFSTAALSDQSSTELSNLKNNSFNKSAIKRQQRFLPRTEFSGSPTKLEHMVDLPGVQAYPGAIFMSGHKGESDNNSCIFLCFFVSDPPATVSEWYANALSSKDWKKEPGGGLSVRASNTAGASVVVGASKSNHGNIHGSVVSITYVQMHDRSN
jgi:hypothetical protein